MVNTLVGKERAGRPAVLLGAPRARLGRLPTPLEALPGLSQALGVEVWLKRDDLNGLPAPGDAVRRLEFLLGDALAWGADVVVISAGPDDGGFLAAAASGAARVGLDCVVVVSDRPPSAAATEFALRTGASFLEAGRRQPLDEAVAGVVGRMLDRGRRPFRIAPAGGSAVGCLGAVAAAFELAEQCRLAGVAPRAWVAPVTSGATLAGLAVGAAMSGAATGTAAATSGAPTGTAGALSGAARNCATTKAEIAGEGLILAGAADSSGRARTSSLARATAVLAGSPAWPFEVYERPPAARAARIGALAARREGLDLEGSPTAGVLCVVGALAASGNLAGPVVVWHPGAPGR